MEEEGWLRGTLRWVVCGRGENEREGRLTSRLGISAPNEKRVNRARGLGKKINKTFSEGQLWPHK